jgi:hypothetical protein
MFFITKYRHNRIVQRYADQTEEYRQALYRKDKMVEIVDLLATRTVELTNKFAGISTSIGSADVMDRLDDTVARFVPDVLLGGQVIKQEGTPVTILDENGKATYGLTKKKPTDKQRFIIHYQF